MTLLSIKQMLPRAQQEGYALLLVDLMDVPSAEGFFAALEEKRSPGIAGVYGGMLERPNARALSSYLRIRAQECSMPVSLMLDHGSSLEQCKRAMEWGYTDVMFDGSLLSFTDNVAVTQQVVEAARESGVGVEAELGHVGSGNEYAEYGAIRLGFTDPGFAADFIRKTDVDFLAIAIGTAHGVYSGDPCLDLDLLKILRAEVDIPLVLHGGTGLSKEQFQSAIVGGISKINVATDMFLTAGKQIKQSAMDGEANYFRLNQAATGAIQDRVAYYLEIFGSCGKI
jgi:fructose-bisphosphate aldolase class II